MHRVGAPVTSENLRYLNAWARAEGGGASNNPFNTTQHAAGASSYNSVGVRNYGSPQQGIEATVQTLENGRYGGILNALRHGNSAVAAAQALAASPWGTGSLVMKILGAGGALGAPAPPAGAVGGFSSPLQNPVVQRVLSSNDALLGVAPPPFPTAVQSLLSDLPSTSGNQGGAMPSPKGSTIKFLENFASPFGLTVTSTTGGTHAPHSYHYQGRAVDFGGNPAKMAALSHYALKHPGDFVEMFYTGPGNSGYFIKNGHAYPNSSLDRHLYTQHTNHVHLAR